MTRPQKPRFINFSPGVTYFKPQGIPLSMLEEAILTMDELEAIRLKYVQGLEQTKCAQKMKISQSTFQRVLSSANKKVAQALTNGQAIRIEGGIVKMTGSRMVIRPGLRGRRRRRGFGR